MIPPRAFVLFLAACASGPDDVYMAPEQPNGFDLVSPDMTPIAPPPPPASIPPPMMRVVRPGPIRKRVDYPR